jgi:hypothetical protein
MESFGVTVGDTSVTFCWLPAKMLLPVRAVQRTFKHVESARFA